MVGRPHLYVLARSNSYNCEGSEVDGRFEVDFEGCEVDCIGSQVNHKESISIMKGVKLITKDFE